jgi:hypothetical protein
VSAAPQKSRLRSRWAIGALIVVVVAAVVVIAVRVYSSDSAPEGAGGADPSASESPAPVEPSAAAVTGCLGGEQRDAAMVRAAQDSAEQSEVGAVEVSAAFVRWLNQYPYPADAEQVQQTALSAEAPTRDLVAFFDAQPDLSGGLVPEEEPYWLSTVSGVYFVESADPDVVTASIGTALVRDGELSPSLKSEGTRTTENLFAIGTPFSGGC